VTGGAAGALDVLAAAILLFGVLAYAMFGGADFGAGFWDLTAGDPHRGQRVRSRIDRSIGPVWEGNHTWLIFCLVVAWTGFPSVFAAVTTTLYLPLGLAALGIVLRGSGFAFRKAIHTAEQQRTWGTAFASSSVITPFFLGTVAGSIASGRVPEQGHGDPVRGWVNPSSIYTGVLAVAICAYLAAVFLAADAHGERDAELERYFRARARLAALLTGAIALAGLPVAYLDAPRLFDGLFGPALPVVVVSVLAGTTALVLIPRRSPRVVRALAGVAAALLVVGWGVAQYPLLLGTHTPIAAAAAPPATLVALGVIFVVAAALVVPSFLLLYVLAQRARLEE
jgi:cytochrome bd ubiquinol oxidase subunit II